MRPLVLGAGGFLGINLVEQLLSEGVLPTCGRRRRSNVIVLRKLGVPMVPADLDQPEQLRDAMRDVDVVFHLAGHYPRTYDRPQQQLADALRRMVNVLDAAAASGVRRLVYVSSTATVAPVFGRPSCESDVYERAPSYGLYHEIKWYLERLVRQDDRVQSVIVCPGACLGPWDIKVGTSSLLVALARGLDPVRPDGVINLVDVRDVATCLTRLGRLESPPRRVLLAASNHRLGALLEALAVRYRVPPPSPPLPAEVAIQVADAAEREALASGTRPALSREIADLVVHGSRVDASLGERRLGVRWRPLASTLDDFDAWARRHHLIPYLQAGEQIA